MAFTLNRRLAQLIDSNGQLNTGKIPNDYITSDHVADNTITSAMLHTSFTVSTSNLTAIDTDDVSEGSTNLYYTDARVGTYISGNRDYGNITTTGYIAGPATFTIDPAAVGDNTGTVVIAGNLQVDGTTTTINSTTMEVDDLNLTLASGAANAAAANGAGITVDGASATITYDGTNDEWDFNKDINVTGNATITTAGSTVLLVEATGANDSRVRVRSGTSNISYIEFADPDDADTGEIRYDHNTNSMQFRVNGNQEAITIDSSQNVGIGETSPETSLHIKNAGNSFLTLERSGTTGGTGKFGINMEGGSSQQTTMAYDDGGKLVIGRSSDPATQAGFSNDFVLDSSGNFGIGGSPTNYSDHKTLSLYGNTGTGAGFIEFNDTSGNADAVIFSDDGNLFINADYDNTAASSSIRFRVDGSSEKMRIDSSGAVGIGQVPETARFSGHDILQVGGRATFLGNDTVSSTGQTALLDNLYYDASGNFQHRGDSRGVAMQFVEGKVIFSNSNQTAGTPTVTTRMTLDNDGNVGIGNSGLALTRLAVTNSVVGANIETTSSDAGHEGLIVNRQNSDGIAIAINKAGSTVGSIDNVGTVLKFKSSNNLHLEQNGNSVTRSLNLTGTAFKPFDSNDNQLDLGTSSATFKDLHLSGGIYGLSDVRTSAVGLGGTPAAQSVGTTYSEPKGVFWHNGGGMTDYSIHRTAGAWSGNYQQLKLDWDTGIFIDGGTSYGKSGVHIHGNISMGDSTYSNFGSPNYPVHICADNYGLMIESGTGYGHLGSNNTAYFHFGGNRTFYFDNRCEANGGFHTYSDENLKKEITVIPSALNKVAQMNGVTFKWKDAAKRGGGDSGKQFGVTAQNMLAVDSELPTKNIDPLYNIEDGVSADDEYYTMDYTRITPFLIEAVKELKTKLEAAEARIEALEG